MEDVQDVEDERILQAVNRCLRMEGQSCRKVKNLTQLQRGATL